MKKEIVDGTIVYSEIYKEGGWDWNILKREGGSISIYATQEGVAVHNVIFDSADNTAPNDKAMEVIRKFKELSGFYDWIKDIEVGE